ncbi:MAG: hypothetical protein FWD69_15725 [Polyangiaceae bacterium]|nr:hypothetical protein [Polyangiaceae bacterium]
MNRLVTRGLSLLSVVFLAIASVRLIEHDKRFWLLVALILVTFMVPAWLSRQRRRALLRSGDVQQILGSWQGSLRNFSYPETMAPLLTATAYAAYGFIAAAEHSLDRAARGPAWDAAMDQRLFIETLLDVYAGERERALSKAAELEQMPLPRDGFWMKRKIALLRSGVSALARAFAHASRASDDKILRSAASSAPLVYWAMHYARAVILVDAGRETEALGVIAAAPAWPEDSAFHAFHSELLSATKPHRGPPN